jgi:hypothetical protein
MYRNPIRRQSKTEARIAQGRTIVRANTAAMSFDNRLTDCQTHSHAGVFGCKKTVEKNELTEQKKTGAK